MRRHLPVLAAAALIGLLAAARGGIHKTAWRSVETARALAAVREQVSKCAPAPRETALWSVTLTTAADCATCRDHLAVWELRPRSADSLHHVLLVYTPPRRQTESELALRAQSTRPICVDTIGTWLRRLPDKRMPSTLLFEGDRLINAWWGALDTPTRSEPFWKLIDSVGAHRQARP